MKKVSIVLLLVAIMVVSMTGCGNAPAEVVEVTPAEVLEYGELHFEANGTYNTPESEAEYVIHRFEAPNDDIVVYEMLGPTYLVGEVAEKKGTKYINMYIENSEFVALSNNYILLAMGEDKDMVAFAIGANDEVTGCTGLMLDYSFDELSEEEKEAFVYPVNLEVVTR